MSRVLSTLNKVITTATLLVTFMISVAYSVFVDPRVHRLKKIGLGFRVWGLGFRASGFGLRVV